MMAAVLVTTEMNDAAYFKQQWSGWGGEGRDGLGCASWRLRYESGACPCVLV